LQRSVDDRALGLETREALGLPHKPVVDVYVGPHGATRCVKIPALIHITATTGGGEDASPDENDPRPAE
jgi:hypothetical protein